MSYVQQKIAFAKQKVPQMSRNACISPKSSGGAFAKKILAVKFALIAPGGYRAELISDC